MNWIPIIVLAAIVLIIIIRIKRRGFFFKAKDGTELSFKQFMKRWGKGIEGITPLQQVTTQLLGIWITITGVIAGIVVNALVRMEGVWWWVEIILVGSLIVTAVSLLGLYQKYKIYKRVDEEMKKLNEELEKEVQVSLDGEQIKGMGAMGVEINEM